MKIVIDAFDALLTEDEQLIELFGEQVNLYSKMARRNAPMPYIVHVLELRGAPLLSGSHKLDIWDYSPNADRAEAISERVKALLAYQRLMLATGTPANYWFTRSAQVATDAQNVHRIALEFSVVAYDWSLVQSVQDR
ncbi:MAG: hypothetical protein AMXMBFR33_01460 [Candidatus Xenobia bacterium]